MARPERNNVDYFPFLCKEGKTMYYIEEKYRNDGFATWIKILRQLAVTDYHYLNLSNKVDIMFLSSKCKVSEQVLIAIIDDLCDMGEFELNLWVESRVLFSVKFVEHIKDAYIKRNNECVSLPGLLTLLDSLGVRKLGKLHLKGVSNTQSKEDYTKEKKTKENQTKEDQTNNVILWPSFEDFWELYDKKEDRSKCEKKWEKIEQGAREKIIQHLDLYIPSTPDRIFRKHPATYLNNESWNNEVIFKTIPNGNKNGFTPEGMLNRLNSYSNDDFK